MDKIAERGNHVDLQLSVLVFEEAGAYLAYCPSLDMSTYGESVNDAKEAFTDMMKACVEYWEQHGTMEKDLTAHGWALKIEDQNCAATPPREVALNIPAGMLRQQYNEPFSVNVGSC